MAFAYGSRCTLFLVSVVKARTAVAVLTPLPEVAVLAGLPVMEPLELPAVPAYRASGVTPPSTPVATMLIVQEFGPLFRTEVLDFLL